MTERVLYRSRRRISVVFAAHGAAVGAFATRIPWLQQHLGLSDSTLGLALLAPALGSFGAVPFTSRLVHRFGNPRALTCLLPLWCASLILPALAPNLPALCVALGLFGAASGMMDVLMNAQGVQVEQRLNQPLIAGLHGIWAGGGLVSSGCGALAAGAGMDARLHFAVAAAVLAGIGLLATRRHLLESDPTEARQPPPRFALPPLSTLPIGILGFCAVFAEGASGNWSAVYLSSTAHASEGVAALSYTGLSFTLALARLSSGFVVSRLGPVRTVRLSGGIAALGGTLVVLARTPPVAIAGFALIGTGVAVVLPLSLSAAGRHGGDPSRHIAGVATFTYTSSLLAPSVTGAVADATSLPAAFALVTAFAAGPLFLAGTLAGPGRPPKGGEDAPQRVDLLS
ncbi:MFS transporter [Streptomyces hygroscopicus]|uniref:MFS transporter n=1 Tax=Streptomyces hygroscopicus TaxID=1912 RepID=UPI0007DB654A|nr:MFS transporter [Streptomyces sp. NBRC 109436]